MQRMRSIALKPPRDMERFHAIFVDDRGAFLGEARLGNGNVDMVTFKMRTLFAKALSLGASGLILAHNHPSGDCRPSPKDISETHRVASIAQALEIELIDHLIITQTDIFSMRAWGKL